MLSAKYEEKNLFYTCVLTVYGRFFHESGFSGSEQDFLADPEPNSGKKTPIRIMKKGPGSEKLQDHIPYNFEANTDTFHENISVSKKNE